LAGTLHIGFGPVPVKRNGRIEYPLQFYWATFDAAGREWIIAPLSELRPVIQMKEANGLDDRLP
jgi:hypothetical protein